MVTHNLMDMFDYLVGWDVAVGLEEVTKLLMLSVMDDEESGNLCTSGVILRSMFGMYHVTCLSFR